jgi:GTP cyclohydrolase I
MVTKNLSRDRLRELADDAALRARVDRIHREQTAYLSPSAVTWASTHAAPLRMRPVAYFSAEFGIHESLPLYSGGLGILSGDHLKSASDLGIPMVGVSLFYREGYFRQRTTETGEQIVDYELFDPEDLPLVQVKDQTGQPMMVELPIQGETAQVAAWTVKLGRLPLYFLDMESAFQKVGIQDLIRDLITLLGEDPRREGLLSTPERVERALRFLTQGYREDVDRLFQGAHFVEPYDEMVFVKDIDCLSLCEHHLIPFFGKCHVAYIPNGKILGLSKIPRLVDVFARRLQVQERLTCQIAETLQDRLQPKGVAVVMEAQHLCVMMRGVQKQNTRMVTSSMLGIFRTDSKTRTEFLSLLRERQGV